MEKDTKVVSQAGASKHPTVDRLRELGELRTRRLSTTELQPPDIESLIKRVQSALRQLARLYDATSISELYHIARAAIKCLFTTQHFLVMERRASGVFTPWDESRDTGPPEGVHDSVHDMVKWAFEAKQVMFCELEEEERTDESSSIGIMPISGDSTHHAVMVFWISDDLSATNVLQEDLIRNLARDLQARTSALIQANRHMTLASLFDNIIESVPHAIIAIAGDDRVVAVNSNAEFLFGFQRIFVMDELFTEALPEELVATFSDLIAKSLMQQGAMSDTEIELDLHGTTISIGISMNLLRDRQGNPQGHLFLCRDLSLSREVQKLREVDALKSEFVNTVSHELKTPLTAILGGLEVLEYFKESFDEETLEMIGVISDGAHRLRDLIFDLLDVSRLEAGRVELRDALTNPKDVIDEALTVQHPHPNHELVVTVPDGIQEVLMDKAKMVQCVTNYVSNAIKYSPEGGRIDIKAEINPATRMLIYSVKDSGIGIPPAALKRVWEKFYRVDASYTSQIEGTGLGLVIVQRIAELHGGTVWVESTVGEGSTFFIAIPIRGGAGE
ncbi:MAG: PAS domain-containing protein [Planctomycetes bacterium]|nr:PAS domain-containing protein [Planctomycetota bacterium]